MLLKRCRTAVIDRGRLGGKSDWLCSELGESGVDVVMVKMSATSLLCNRAWN